MSSASGQYEIIARQGEDGPCLIVSATIRSREQANAFVTAFDPIQIALFPGDEGGEAAEHAPDEDGADADGEGDDDAQGDDEADAPTPRAAPVKQEPLPGTKAGDVLAALRVGVFDHRDSGKRLGMSRYEARTIYERLVANGHWTNEEEEQP